MARHYAPSTIFIDEIDSLCSTRGADSEHESSRRVKSEILMQMDGLSSESSSSQVTVLGATNFPWAIDEALRRRLEKRIYIPLPDLETRTLLLHQSLENIEHDIDIPDAAAKLNGYSCSDIVSVCRGASILSMRRVIRGLTTIQMRSMSKGINFFYKDNLNAPITQQDFDATLQKTKSSVGTNDLKKFEAWMLEFGSA
jgi:katanin p60 ATPase-containing subunit A1